jgi:hypothetical protein
MNDYARKLKKLTDIKKKTDEIHSQVREAEWFGSLYVDDELRPCLLSDNVEGMIVEAAKKLRLGQQAKASVLAAEPYVRLVTDAPAADARGLWAWMVKNGAVAKYADTRGVRVNQKRVMRTRPIFRRWSVEVRVEVETDDLDERHMRQILEVGGRRVGLGDYRPKFGKFAFEMREVG